VVDEPFMIIAPLLAVIAPLFKLMAALPTSCVPLKTISSFAAVMVADVLLISSPLPVFVVPLIAIPPLAEVIDEPVKLKP